MFNPTADLDPVELKAERPKRGINDDDVEAKRQAILQTFNHFPDGATKCNIIDRIGRGKAFDGAWQKVCNEGDLTECTVSKGNRQSYDGFRRTYQVQDKEARHHSYHSRADRPGAVVPVVRVGATITLPRLYKYRRSRVSCAESHSDLGLHVGGRRGRRYDGAKTRDKGLRSLISSKWTYANGVIRVVRVAESTWDEVVQPDDRPRRKRGRRKRQTDSSIPPFEEHEDPLTAQQETPNEPTEQTPDELTKVRRFIELARKYRRRACRENRAGRGGVGHMPGRGRRPKARPPPFKSLQTNLKRPKWMTRNRLG